MRLKLHQLQKKGLILLTVLFVKCNLKAQPLPIKKTNKIYTSADVTMFGTQGRLAYDFYTAKGNCYGVSISQLGGIKKETEDNTRFYDFEEIRINMSVRYTKNLFEYKRLQLLGILQAGISYNTILTGEQLILPSFRIGGGADITIFKSSGIRLEAGIGSPYFVSIGYFFTI